MRALWKGAISFGLVTIPVSLFPATRQEELKFRLLRRSDLSPVNYKRVAEADGKEVPWEQIVKGCLTAQAIISSALRAFPTPAVHL
jgi:DNA end-binding protein Ku